MITDAFLMVPFARVEPGDWDWAALGTIATALAAVVTAITVVFVARQTSATRKAAEEAERSADAANKALDYAQTQLDFSRQQHLQSLYMTAEAVKSRIDAEMPRLVLEEATVLPEATVDGGAPLPEAFFDPLDRKKQIEHKLRIRVKNDGPRTAKLLFSEHVKYRWFDSQGTERLQQYLIPGKSFAVGVGEALAADFTLTTTAGFWMDAHTSRARGETPDNYPQFSFRYLTDADTGAHEEHTITLSGEALEPDPHQNGRWAHRLEQEINGETSPFAAFVEPIRRLYFISRVRNEPLPELSWKEISELPLPLKEPKGG